MNRHNTSTWAKQVARELLEGPLPRRWAHTQGVAAQARRLQLILGKDADLIVAAAWLHDIGYSPGIALTGFHPLDGARYLRDIRHAHTRLCRLVAHHSCAAIEAEERGLCDVLSAEFQPERPELTDALTYCDMTTGPDGRHLTVDERLTEIQTRYGQGHTIQRTIQRATPRINDAAYAVGLIVAQSRCPR